MDQKTLDRLEGILDGLVKYNHVYCESCDFSEYAWLKREAEIRAQVHEHDCTVQEVVLVDQDTHGLGLNND